MVLRSQTILRVLSFVFLLEATLETSIQRLKAWVTLTSARFSGTAGRAAVKSLILEDVMV